jgi:hypothetical protein
MNETDVITVSDKAISVNGNQDSWALSMYKLDHLYEVFENTVVEMNLTGDAYAPEQFGEYPHVEDECRSLEHDEDDVAWR